MGTREFRAVVAPTSYEERRRRVLNRAIFLGRIEESPSICPANYITLSSRWCDASKRASDGLSHLLRLPLSPSLEAILSQQDGSRWRAASNLSLMLTSLPSFLLLRDLRVNIGIALTGLVNFALAFDYVLLVQERMMQ